jgi:hypothetical protein
MGSERPPVEREENMMIRQRWGTFSGRDHLREQAFVAEVLLDDRLVVSAPPENNRDEERRWEPQGWRPDRLLALLGIIGVVARPTFGDLHPEYRLKRGRRDYGRDILAEHRRRRTWDTGTP